MMNENRDKTHMDNTGTPLMSWSGGAEHTLLDHQLTVLTYTSRHHVNRHGHLFHELVLISKGSCIHQFRGHDEVLIPGDCFLIPPGEVHAYSITSETEIINCLFYESALGPCLDELTALPHVRCVLEPGAAWHVYHLPPMKLALARQILQQVAACAAARRETNPVDPAADAAADLTGRHALVLLLLLLADQAVQTDSRTTGRTADSLAAGSDQGRLVVGAMLAFMQEHYREPLSMQDIASHVHLSEGHCRRLFSRYTGYPPMIFLNRLRINQAMSLLESGQLSVTQVAERVGFQDAGYFSRLFRKTMHTSPSRFMP